MTTKQGVVEQISQKSDRGEGGIKVNGSWFNYSKPDKREGPWTEPKAVGDEVKFDYDEWEYSGKTYTGIKTLAVLHSANGASPAGESRNEFRSPSQIIRTEALRIASEALSVRAPQDYDLTAFSSAVIVLAGEYSDFIENGLS